MGTESSGSDLVVAFNEEMVRLNDENPLSRAKCVAVGLPREFRKLKKKSRRTISHPVWYIRTSLYQSNLSRLHRGLCDWDMYQREIKLIESVFSKLPHGVIYKPYPAIRYLDPDPAIECASKCNNMRVYEERLDLRYEVTKCRVLVTSGATGTVSYCLMSDRPTVFISGSNFMPLKKDIAERFEACLFLFDESDPDFIDKLRGFLEQPLDQIDAQWRAKAVERRDFVQNYLSSSKGKPGKTAAAAIDSFVREYAMKRERAA
jgi:hypothetical protein